MRIFLSACGALAHPEQTRRGGYVKAFFKADLYKRRSGERVADWLSRWEEGVKRLRQDGVDFAGLALLTFRVGGC